MIKYSNTYLELDHLVGEAHALLSNDVFNWDPDVLKGQDGRVRCLEFQCDNLYRSDYDTDMHSHL